MHAIDGRMTQPACAQGLAAMWTSRGIDGRNEDEAAIGRHTAGISVEKYADANESHARPCDSDAADELVRGAAVLSLRGRRLALKLTQLLVPNSLK